MTGQRPFRGQHLHQMLKRHILMIKRAQRRVPDPPQHLPQLRIPGQIRPHHQRVHEKPDQVIEGLIGAARHRRPHRNIRPRPQPRQQHRHRRMHRHEQRHPVRPGQGGELAVHPARNRQRGRVPPVGGHRRAGPVHRQRQLRRGPGQRLPPVGDLPGQHTARIILSPQQLPLPQRIIGVLHRQRRPPRRPPRPPRRIRHRHIPRQRPHRPAITRDVMHHQHQHMHPRPGHQQPRPPRHLRRQIKRLPRHRRHHRSTSPAVTSSAAVTRSAAVTGSPASTGSATVPAQPPAPVSRPAGPAGTAARPRPGTPSAAPHAAPPHPPAPHPAPRYPDHHPAAGPP